ncbi:hypothetical protein [Aliiroseovarius sp.]|uniref:COG4223 family protein n=1 Tax=Aliiroseovarius sp. TaxID=1872442 RepID=UPI0026249D1A|nr:hypothetical protein [Aliiroseovarius sp.]
MAKSPKTPKEEVQDPVEGAVIPDQTASKDVPQDSQPDTVVGADAPEAETAEDLPEIVLNEEDPVEAEDDPRAEEAGDGTDTGQDSPEEIAEETSAPSEPAIESHVEPVPTVAEPAARRGGFAPMVLGGVIAAGLGFVGAQYPDQWPFPEAAEQPNPLAAAVEAQSARLDALDAANGDAAAAIAVLQGDDAVDRLTETLAGVTASLADLDTRLTAVEKLPTGDGTEAAEAAAAAYQRELSELRAMFEAELAKVSAVQQDAQALSASAATRAALANVLAALDSGAPFDEAAKELSDVIGAPLPDPLPEMAADGVPTLATLQESFPEAARAALDIAIRAAVEDGSMGRTQAFLRTQLGVRSLEPKEGDDADAVLSRAEEALRHGQITVALSELSALSKAAQPALADWISTAQARAAALDAGQVLATQVNK